MNANFFCDYIADPDNHFTGLDIWVLEPGVKNYLEYLNNTIFVINGFPARDPQDRLWRGVFAYVSWGYAQLNGQMKWEEPEYVNWDFYHSEPPNAEVNACRIWARRGLKAKAKLYQYEPNILRGFIRTPGLILE